MSIDTESKLFFRGFYIEIFLRLVAYLYKGSRNISWLLMSVAGRFSIIRVLAKKLAKQINLQQYKSCPESSIFQNVNVAEVVKELKQTGLSIGIRLPDGVLEEILEFAQSTPCYGDFEPHNGFLYSEKDEISQIRTFFTAQYFNTSLHPAIQTLARDPTLLEIAATYLNAEPIFTGSRLWWNFKRKQLESFYPFKGRR